MKHNTSLIVAMRASISAALCLLAVTAFAQQPSQPQPDYSREALLRILAEPPAKKEAKRVQWRSGAIEVRALGVRWRFLLIPLLVPFRAARLGNTAVYPDAFEETGTHRRFYPVTEDDRWEIDRERERIEATIRDERVEKDR